MAKRISRGVERAIPIEIVVDGIAVEAYPGETIATALIAAGQPTFSYNWNGRPRGPVCNMGVCYECLVETRRGADEGDEFRLQRACMTTVADGLVVRTTRHRA